MRLAQSITDTLTRLEQRSASEKAEVDRLNEIGAAVTRAAAPNLMLDVGPQVGQLLNVLVRITNARQVVEIGGSVGYSTIWIAEALSHTGGRVVSIEPEPGKADQLKTHLADANLADYAEVIVDDARLVMPLLPGPFDMVLIDHWKDIYIREFDAAWPKLRSGGVIVADNILRPQATADLMQAYLNHVRVIPNTYSFTLNVGDGVELTWRMQPEEE